MPVLTLELREKQKALLAAEAQAKGLSAEEYAQQVLEHDLVPEWLGKSWESSKAAGLDTLSTEEIHAEIVPPGKRGVNPGCNRDHDPGRPRHEYHCLCLVAASRTTGPDSNACARRLRSTLRQRRRVCGIRRSHQTALAFSAARTS